MYIGQSLDPSGVIKGVQIAEHRLLFAVDLHLVDNELRHQIATKKYRDDTILTNGGISLLDFIDQCKKQDVIPIVNLSFFRAYRKDGWISRIPPEQFGRCSRIVADLLTENFNLSVIAPFNEPRKWLNDNLTGIYTKFAYDSIPLSQHSKIKFSIGNEEYFVSLFQHLGNIFRNKTNVIFGAHLLSSIGTWDNPRKYFNRILAWKILANSYGLEILNIEGGAWFNYYCTNEGHSINKDIVRLSKQYGYWASNIVLIDNNSVAKYKRLGYRRYDNDYIRPISEPMMNENISYFQDFMNFIKREGQKVPIPEPIIEEEDMILVTMQRGVKHPAVRWLQQILEEDYDVINDYGKYDGDFGIATERQVKAYQKKIGVSETGIIRATDVIKIYEESSEPAIWFKRLNVHASYQ